MVSHRSSDGDGNKITISDLMWKIACIIPKLNFEIASSCKLFFSPFVIFASLLINIFFMSLFFLFLDSIYNRVESGACSYVLLQF